MVAIFNNCGHPCLRTWERQECLKQLFLSICFILICGPSDNDQPASTYLGTNLQGQFPALLILLPHIKYLLFHSALFIFSRANACSKCFLRWFCWLVIIHLSVSSLVSKHIHSFAWSCFKAAFKFWNEIRRAFPHLINQNKIDFIIWRPLGRLWCLGMKGWFVQDLSSLLHLHHVVGHFVIFILLVPLFAKCVQWQNMCPLCLVKTSCWA